MRKYRKALAGGALTLALLVPAGAAVAANGSTPSTCTGDQRQEQVHDGTQAGQMAQHQYGRSQADQNGMAGHRSGPQDGSGPQADRPMDGTGFRWGAAS